MSDLTRDEQHLVSWWGYVLIQCVASPGAHDGPITHCKYGQSGGTREWDGRRGWQQTTNAGIGWSHDLLNLHSSKPSDYELFVTWTRFSEHARSVTTPARTERARAHLKRGTAHQLGSKSYPGSWRGVPWIVPRTADGETYEDVQEWHRTVHMPEYHAIHDERRALLEEFLPLLTDDEPVDLLELLGAMG